jgi:hypothetical protein
MYTEPASARFPQYGAYTALLAGPTFLVSGFASVAYLSSVLLRLKLEEESADPFIFCILVANALPALAFSFVAYHVPSKSLGCLVAIGAFVRTYAFLTGISWWFLGPERQFDHAEMCSLIVLSPHWTVLVEGLIGIVQLIITSEVILVLLSPILGNLT